MEGKKKKKKITDVFCRSPPLISHADRIKFPSTFFIFSKLCRVFFFCSSYFFYLHHHHFP
jgi:hypothetical protein